MRNATVLTTAGLGVFWLSMFGACGSDPAGEEPTVASVGASTTGTGSSSSASSGQGGATGAGGMTGSGGMGTGGATTSSTTGSGGAGGSGPIEPVIHGCLSTGAGTQDLGGGVGMTVNITNPLTAAYCRMVKVGTDVMVDGTGVQGGPLIVGGTYDGAVKQIDTTSPITPSDVTCPKPGGLPDPNNAACYNAATWSFTTAGTFPFYDNSDPAANRGVFYVVP
jgi:hypothetical protein